MQSPCKKEDIETLKIIFSVIKRNWLNLKLNFTLFVEDDLLKKSSSEGNRRVSNGIFVRPFREILLVGVERVKGNRERGDIANQRIHEKRP